MPQRPPTGAGLARPPTRNAAPAGGYVLQPVVSSEMGLGRGATPGTASRRPVGTSYGQQGAVGVSVLSQVKVSDRPLTREGMRTATALPPGTAAGQRSRMVQDRSYFLGEIRLRIQNVEQEILKLRSEDEQIQRDNASFAHFQKKNETLSTAVQSLRQEMGDYNMVIEKAGMDETPTQIAQESAAVRQANEDTKKRLDQLFIDRANKEASVQDMYNRIAAFQDRMEAKLDTDPQKKHEYHALRAEVDSLSQEISIKQNELGLVIDKTENIHAQVQANPQLRAIAALEQERRRLEDRARELEEDGQRKPSQGAAAPFQQPVSEKDELLRKVQEENKRIQQLQQEISELKENIEVYAGTSPQKPAARPAAAGSGSDELSEEHLLKLKELQQKDAEMTTFIDDFDATMKAEHMRRAMLEESIVGLLEHISRTSFQQNALPSQQQHSEMQADLEFKTKQKEFAESTFQHLQVELEERRAELEKMKTLDVKIARELETLKDKMATMNEELRRYSDIEKVKRESEESRVQLSRTKSTLVQTRDGLKQRVQSLAGSYESRKQELASNQIHSSLEAIEARIRFSEQNVFALREYVMAKGEETNYEPRKRKVIQLIHDINQDLLASHQQQQQQQQQQQ